MRRAHLVLALFVPASLVFACTGRFGQNGLDVPADGVLPLPHYVPAPPVVFDASFDADAADAADAAVDAPEDASDDGEIEGSADGPVDDAATDAATDGAPD